MDSDKNESKSNDSQYLHTLFMLFVMFFVLKTTDNIDWSWWWVTAPLWIPLALSVVIGGVTGGVIAYKKIVAENKAKKAEEDRKARAKQWINQR